MAATTPLVPPHRILVASALMILALFARTAPAQSTADSVPTIIEQIGELEAVRDPKCYATASRLEDFIYGTPLEEAARFEKIDLQKALIRSLWLDASQQAKAAGLERVEADVLLPILERAIPRTALGDGGFRVGEAVITARDRRQYGSIAYALRAVLAVQQDALLAPDSALLPLAPESVALFKETIDLATLAALQHADRAAREAQRHEISAHALRAAWARIAPASEPVPEPPTRRAARAEQRYATLRAVIDEKITAFQEYNRISMPVFLRNLQVYFARHAWPEDPEEGKLFKDEFTETMIAFTGDVLLDAEGRARKAGRAIIRVEDVAAALQKYQPHVANEYEDIIFFPRLPREDQITIEAYDLDAFRDPGIHWFYLEETISAPGWRGTLEPDPFAAELLVEGVAQMGVLVLRVAGMIAGEKGSFRLERADLHDGLRRIQSLLDRHAAAPPLPAAPAAIASAATPAPDDAGTWFTDVTASSGIAFEHRHADWLARLIRSYSVVDGNVVRLAVPPAFGGSGVAAEDIDGDDDVDILILGGAGNRLYLNDGEGRYTDVTREAGLEWKRPDGTFGEPRQPIVADFDNDGRQDILITYANDAHRLYRNLGGHRFEDVTARAGLGGEGLVGGPATALDFDEDGLLDVYIGYFGDYVKGIVPTLSRHNTNALPDKLFRNEGNFTFEDVSAGSGIENPGWAQAVGHIDFDGDGREDLVCGNDFGVNAYYRNLGGGKFADVSAELALDKPSYTMNLGFSDLNRDGFPDIYVSNIVTMDKDQKYILPDEKTRMALNPEKMANMRVVEANDLFTSVARDGELVEYAKSEAVGRGYRSTGWSWDADFFDFDNDADDDLYVVNGMNEYAVYTSVNPYFTDSEGKRRDIIMPVALKERNVFFLNEGGRLTEHSDESGAALLGNSRSVAYLDSDGDGDLDMIVNAFNGPATFYRNDTETAGNHWIKIRLEGDPDRGVTRDAIGARILVDTAHHRDLWRYVFSTTGYLSVHPKEQHLGLGADAEADVTVIWPNGEKSVFPGLAANRTWHIVQGRGIVTGGASRQASESP